jgi:hypothetical protein
LKHEVFSLIVRWAELARFGNQTAPHGYAIGSFKNEEQGTAGFIGRKTRAALRCDCGTQIKRLASRSYHLKTTPWFH